MGNEVTQPWPKLLQTQSTQGRILCENAAGEVRLTRLEMDGYKTKNSSSKIKNMWYFHSMGSYKTFVMKGRHHLTSVRDICLAP